METCLNAEVNQPNQMWMRQGAHQACTGSVLGAPFSRRNCSLSSLVRSQSWLCFGQGGWTRDLLKDPVILSSNFLTKSPHPTVCVNSFTESLKKINYSAQKNSCQFIKQLHEVTMFLSYFAKLCIGKGLPIKRNCHPFSSYNLQTKLFIILYSLLNTCKGKSWKAIKDDLYFL